MARQATAVMTATEAAANQKGAASPKPFASSAQEAVRDQILPERDGGAPYTEPSFLMCYRRHTRSPYIRTT